MIVKDNQENYSSGWIKVYRSLYKKGWYKRSDYIHLWIHLLFKASHKEIEFMFNGKNIKIKPGQFITGRKALNLETGINESKIERILSFFEKNEQQIEQQKSNKNRLISILNWDEYQLSEQLNEQQVNNKRTTSEQQVNTYKKNKNDKKYIESIENNKEKFKTEIRKYIGKVFKNGEFTNDDAIEFFTYWGESNKTKTKLRYEGEKTWDTNGRISRWMINKKKGY